MVGPVYPECRVAIGASQPPAPSTTITSLLAAIMEYRATISSISMEIPAFLAAICGEVASARQYGLSVS